MIKKVPREPVCTFTTCATLSGTSKHYMPSIPICYFALLVFLIQMALFCTLGIAHSDGPALHSVYFSSTWTCFALLVFLIRMALFCILGIPPTNGPDLHSWYSSYKWPCFSFLVFYIQMDLSCILGIPHPNRLVFVFSVFLIP